MTAPTDRPLAAAELETVLAGLPGWTLVANGSAILRDIEFREWAGAVLFVAFFGALPPASRPTSCAPSPTASSR